jgi:hypothetical protein
MTLDYMPSPERITHQPISYYTRDKFVTRIQDESGTSNRRWTQFERDELEILTLNGFTDTQALSKDFVLEVSRRFPDLRLDADSVRSPIPRRRTLAKGGVTEVPQKLHLMDYERLHKGEWFNDRLIQFWRCWLQHGPNYNREKIDFYDPLQFEKSGLNGKKPSEQKQKKKGNLAENVEVRGGAGCNGKSEEVISIVNKMSEEARCDSVRKHLTPFDKKMVLIPLNLTGVHWNLAVLLNLDALKGAGGPKEDRKSPMPCMLLLDSKSGGQIGSREEHTKILSWLGRIEPALGITKDKIPLFVPPVLMQDDDNSCGPLSIMNALCMIRLHKQAFTYEFAGVDLAGKPLKGCGKPFVNMVERRLEFCYSLHDVDRILNEMRCIVNELSTQQREGKKRKSP